MLLIDIDITLPRSSLPLKINRIIKKRMNVNVPNSGITRKSYVLTIVPMLIFTGIGVGTIFHMYKKLNRPRIVKHVSAMP